MNKILIDIIQVIEILRLILKIPHQELEKDLYDAVVSYEDCVKWLNWLKSLPAVQNYEKGYCKFNP